jgi:DHA1 family multidrug resistance protein-like MFS transporter
MADILRDSAFGQLVRFITRDRFLAHDDEVQKFEATWKKEQSVDLERTGSHVLSAPKSKDGTVLVGWYTSGEA